MGVKSEERTIDYFQMNLFLKSAWRDSYESNCVLFESIINLAIKTRLKKIIILSWSANFPNKNKKMNNCWKEIRFIDMAMHRIAVKQVRGFYIRHLLNICDQLHCETQVTYILRCSPFDLKLNKEFSWQNSNLNSITQCTFWKIPNI